jgi:hypothetical protein
MNGIPEQPEGIAFILWIASLVAAYDPGNSNAKVAAVLDLFAECRRAADGERPAQHDRGALQ